MVSRISTLRKPVSYGECFIVTRTGYYIGKHEEMKVKHKGTKSYSKEGTKLIHEAMKLKHKEPPWVACPMCGEPL